MKKNNQLPSLLILILTLMVSCNSGIHKNEEFDNIYQTGLHNFYTSRDSVDFYYELLEQNLQKANNKNNQAKFSYFKGIRYMLDELPDSALNCFLNTYNLVKRTNELKANVLASLVAVSSNLHNDSLHYKYFTEFELISKKLKKPFICGRFFGVKATSLVRRGDIVNGIKYYKKADSIFNSIEAPVWRVHNLYSLGKNYVLKGNYDLAYQYYLQAIELAKQENITRELANCYLGLSRLYRKLEQYDDAIIYLNKFNQLFTQKKYKARAYEGYAIIYAEQKKWDEAEKYMLKSLEVREQIKQVSSIAVVKNNLGTLYTQKRDYINAEKYYLEALELRYKNNLQGTGLLKNLNNLGDLYLKQNKINLAANLFEKAIEFTDKNPNIRLSAHAHLQLANIYKSQGLLEKSLEQYLKHAEEDKKLNAEKAKQNLARLIVEHDSKNQKHIIELQKKEVTQKKNAMIWLIIAIVFLLISATIILRWYYYRNKSLKKDIEQQKQINAQQLEINQLKERIENCINNNEQSLLIKDLINLFTNKKIYTNPELSLEKLARLLNTNTSYISSAINSEFGCNFKSLVNRYRIEFCKEKLKENSKFDFPIKKVAMEAGFISISTFYSSFKKETGITPAQFRSIIKAEQNL